MLITQELGHADSYLLFKEITSMKAVPLSIKGSEQKSTLGNFFFHKNYVSVSNGYVTQTLDTPYTFTDGDVVAIPALEFASIVNTELRSLLFSEQSIIATTVGGKQTILGVDNTLSSTMFENLQVGEKSVVTNNYPAKDMLLALKSYGKEYRVSIETHTGGALIIAGIIKSEDHQWEKISTIQHLEDSTYRKESNEEQTFI